MKIRSPNKTIMADSTIAIVIVPPMFLPSADTSTGPGQKSETGPFIQTGGDSHVNLVPTDHGGVSIPALHRIRIHLYSELVLQKLRVHFQIVKPRHSASSFNTMRINDSPAQHLKAAANSDKFASPLHKCIEHRDEPILSHIAEISLRVLASRDNDHVRPGE